MLFLPRYVVFSNMLTQVGFLPQYYFDVLLVQIEESKTNILMDYGRRPDNTTNFRNALLKTMNRYSGEQGLVGSFSLFFIFLFLIDHL